MKKRQKLMIFNYSKNNQFTTRLSLNNANIEVVDKIKLLGTTITNDLKWDENTDIIIKKANQRMQILRKAATFDAPKEDLNDI